MNRSYQNAKARAAFVKFAVANPKALEAKFFGAGWDAACDEAEKELSEAREALQNALGAGLPDIVAASVRDVLERMS